MKRTPLLRGLLALVVLLAPGVLLLTGCVSGAWRHDHRFVAPPQNALSLLEPGNHDLSQCLEELGAPLFVYETPAGFALAYGWFESAGLSGRVSVPVSESVNASFSMSDVDDNMRGLVLFFGPETELLLVQRGSLRDLTAGAMRVRPSLVDDED